MKNLFLTISLILIAALPINAGTYSGVQFAGVNIDAPELIVSAAYESVIVIGDTQFMTLPSSTRYAELVAQVDWIIANKAAENINFVMMMGDLIDTGTNLPLSSACNAGAWTTVRTPLYTACSTDIGDPNEATCNSTDGCGWSASRGGCDSCQMAVQAGQEWVNYEVQQDRLEAAGVVTFLNKGNHDNDGLDSAVAGGNDGREPSGYEEDRYNTAYWVGLETGAYSSEVYDHVADNNLVASGNAHAWTTAIGAEPILVVTLPYISQQSPPVAVGHQAWFEAQCAANPTLPVWLMTHHNGSVRGALAYDGDACPNLMAISGGHTYQNEAFLYASTSGATNTFLDTVTDYSSSQLRFRDIDLTPRRDFITHVKFYLDESPTKIELVDIAPDYAGGMIEQEDIGWDWDGAGPGGEPAGENSITKQAFDIMPPTLYDLSSIDAQMTTVFGASPPEFAVQPVTDKTCAATSVATLQNCLARGEPTGSDTIDPEGTRITVAAGLYDSDATWEFTNNNQWLDMDPATIIEGNSTISTVSRFKLSGGTIRSDEDNGTLGNSQKMQMLNYTDVTFDGVTVNYDSTANAGVNFCTATGTQPCDRLTILSTTFRANRGTGFFQHNTTRDATDIIMADSYFYANYAIRDDRDPDGDNVNDEQTFRVMTTNNVLLVDSYIEHGPLSPKALWRQHYGNDNVLVANNIFCSRYTSPGNSYIFWLKTQAGGAEDDDINNSYFYNNDVYDHNSAPLNVQPFALDDDPAGGPTITNVTIDGNNYYSVADRIFDVNFGSNLTAPGPVTYLGTQGGGTLPGGDCPTNTNGSGL